ncbi:amino acid--[acyl-carrier-protein] ligase [Piscinibacter sakaiensis]|uniref:Archaeal seryl-tRNA synthetase-related sequence n=1 Tax=Piscinibacter sakaiensis TaxID=1547922 RepID=A0A0K8P0Z7_PISS1|nr:amino acid--[acyl-carrier-protein] ligase [Piscinibacter sakaiensis]GAP35845.1 archaeal seryl-tRNA synthetase-related sequence [Piscinibacter sakaiensis]
MTAPAPDFYDPAAFMEALVAAGLVIPTPVQGGWGRGPVFEDLLQRFDAHVMREAADDGATELTFPPIIARTMIESLGYLDNFPQLVGSIHSFFGKEAQARELSQRVHDGQRWEDLLDITESMLLPAACYPVYPVFSGLLPEGGRLVTVKNWCYRHEPSAEPTRLQSFRMREFIRVGRPDEVEAWRDAWLHRGLALLRGLGLPVESDVANDPFFGRAGKMMAVSQREQRLKFEIVVPVIAADRPTAICSFNWHQEHFSGKFGIRAAGGETAHTACLGFGLERVTLALLKHHGLDPAAWPADVRQALWP